MKYKVYDCNSYKIHTIKTDKFKTCSIEVMFSKKLKKDEITINNMLCDMLMYSNEKYQSKREVVMALENLYDAYIRAFSTRIGQSLLVSFVTDFLNPKYCDEGFLEEIIKFSFEMILKPNVKDEEFDKKSFNIVKNRIKADIESLKENPTKYAFRRALLNMDEDSISSYSMAGYLEDLDNITPSSLYKYYNELLENEMCDIYVIGNLDMDNVVSLIKKYFTIKTLKEGKLKLYVKNKVRKKYIDIKETGKFEQASFIMINNLCDLSKRERDVVIHMYNFLLGAGGLTTKLYKYLREENSLCYFVSSMYQKYDQLLMIHAGIAAKDKAKCEKLVNKALKEMVDGVISDEEIENAKKNLVSSIKMSEDTPGGIINNYLFNEIDDLPTFEERIKEIKSVTKEEIVQLARKVKLNTVYLLAGEES